jgi:DNA-binding NtrC family response regulator
VADLSSLFIWLVEDDEIARVATGAFLEELGILIEQASSFEELEQELLFTERRPDLVISDSRLPGGRTADEVIATFVCRWDADVPVIVLTGEAAYNSAEAKGSNIVVLKKPASPEDIVGAICRLCFRVRDGPAASE